VRVALFQGPETPAGVAGNLDRLETVAADAAARDARLLILPEMYLTGYNIGKEAVRELAEPAAGPSSERAVDIARKCGVALIYGYPERDGDAVYNACLLIDRDGRRLANYRKSHLFGELDRSMFDAGPGDAVLAELDGTRLGMLICYDLEFPENARRLALSGVDFIAVPTALMHPYEFIARSMVPSRAYENQVFIAYANRCGRESELGYYGLSCIVGPDGNDLARAGSGEELIVADLDFGLLERSRRINTYLADRRPSLYGALTKPSAESGPTRKTE
jgi:predicted amidohydrolase